MALADDALTTGRSLVEAAARVRETGAEIVAAYVLVDREEDGAAGRLAAGGLPVRALFRRSELLTPAGEPRPDLA